MNSVTFLRFLARQLPAPLALAAGRAFGPRIPSNPDLNPDSSRTGEAIVAAALALKLGPAAFCRHLRIVGWETLGRAEEVGRGVLLQAEPFGLSALPLLSIGLYRGLVQILPPATDHLPGLLNLALAEPEPGFGLRLLKTDPFTTLAQRGRIGVLQAPSWERDTERINEIERRSGAPRLRLKIEYHQSRFDLRIEETTLVR